jgi:hypothetical protein
MRDRERAWWRRWGTGTRVAVRVAFCSVLALAACVFASPRVAGASASGCAVKTWTGGGDASSWRDRMNWNPPAAPKPCDSVSIGPTAVTPFPSILGVPAITLTELSLDGVQLAGGTGPVTVTADFSWSSSGSPGTSDIAVPVTVDGTASFSGTDEKLVHGTTLTLDGASTVSDSGPLDLDNTAQLVNNNTLTLSVGSMIGDGNGGTTHTIVNNGSLVVPASGTATMDLYDTKFDDPGTVSVGAGSTLAISGGTTVLASTTNLDGGGTVQFDDATTGTTVTLASGVTISGATTLQVAGPSYTFLKGTGDFDGTGTFLWTGGTILGDLSVASTVTTTVSGSGTKSLQGGSLTLAGNTTVSDPGPVDLSNAADLVNNGTLTLSTGSMIGDGGGGATHTFTNNGSLVLRASTSATLDLYDARFEDPGAVSVAVGSTLAVSDGATSLAPTTTFAGGGTAAFNTAGTVKSASGVSVGTGTKVALAGPVTLDGTGSFTGAGAFVWDTGTIVGKLTVSTASTLIKGSAAKTLSGGTLTLDGTTTVSGSGPVELANGSHLVNAGNLTLGDGTTIEYGGGGATDTFSNSGTLVSAAGTGSAAITGLNLTTTGTVQIASGTLNVDNYQQTAGTTTISEGTLSSAEAVVIAGGQLTGSGTVAASVINAGTIAPATTGGVLSITGTYTQKSTGAFAITVEGTTPGNGFGQLAVTGTATLGGQLSVSTGAGFTPTSGETFSVVTSGSRARQFSSITGAPPYTVRYSPTGALVVFS